MIKKICLIKTLLGKTLWEKPYGKNPSEGKKKVQYSFGLLQLPR